MASELPADVQAVAYYLAALKKAEFHGTVTLCFDNSSVIQKLQKEESVRVQDLKLNLHFIRKDSVYESQQGHANWSSRS